MYVKRILLAAFSLILLFIAFGEIDTSSRSSGISAVSKQLESGQSVRLDVIAHYAKEAHDASLAGACRTDVLMSGATVVLANLDMVSPVIDFDRWSSSIQDAQVYFERALICWPSNGNFWLRLAMIKRAIAEVPLEQRQLLTRSQTHAPAEDEVVRARLMYYTRLEEPTIAEVHAQLSLDIERYLKYGIPRESIELARLIKSRFPNDFFNAYSSLGSIQTRRWERAGLNF